MLVTWQDASEHFEPVLGTPRFSRLCSLLFELTPDRTGSEQSISAIDLGCLSLFAFLGVEVGLLQADSEAILHQTLRLLREDKQPGGFVEAMQAVSRHLDRRDDRPVKGWPLGVFDGRYVRFAQQDWSLDLMTGLRDNQEHKFVWTLIVDLVALTSRTYETLLRHRQEPAHAV